MCKLKENLMFVIYYVSVIPIYKLKKNCLITKLNFFRVKKYVFLNE